MLARRLAIGCGAVVMLAVAGFVPAAASSTATSTICVGLIIDSQSIGGSVSAKCVNVHPGTTGVGVLEAAGHSVTFRHDGLLCTIDDVPSSGCEDVDNTHYWAYFHRAPDATTWSYSNENMSTYKPPNRSTEGWVYDDGTALKPKNIPAGQMCAGLLKPSPSPTPQPTKTHRAVTPTHSPNSPTPQPTSTSPSAAPTKPHRRHHHPSGATATPPDAAATPSSEAPPSTAAVAGDTASKSGGAATGSSATGAIVAAAVIAVIAAATVTAARRRRR